MKWQLEALKALSQNPTVPGVALLDAVTEIEKLQKQLTVVLTALHFNERAAKLSLKQKPFIVVAHDEPYFMAVYKMIRHNEILTGRWSDEDEMRYIEALKASEG